MSRITSEPGHVVVGKTDYDLTTDEGREAFGKDVVDGKVDGKARGHSGEFDGVTYDQDRNTVYVGDTTYCLSNPEDLVAFDADRKDGHLDGAAGHHSDKEVTVDGKTYDLSSEKGRRAFEAGWDTNGIETNDGFKYDKKTNKITTGGGEKTYDLDTAKGRRDFQLDSRDGNLDGKRTDQDLREVHIGNATYDLSNRAGRDAFKEAWDKGDIALETNDGFNYDPETNKITSGGGERTYDLNSAKERAAFRKDIADGNFDGAATLNDPSRVRVAGQDFDLTTQAGRDKFNDAWENGSLGVGTNDGFKYDPKTNRLTDGSGERTYDLNKPSEVASFHRDIADGELDNKGNEGKEIPGYLQNVQIGHKSYDLSTDKGKEAFAADIVDGKFDGKAKNKGGNWKGVDYDPETQTVTAGDRVYDLTNPKDFHDFQRDAADGKLGGEARKPLPHERLRG
jgi:hypothetical protein